MSFTERGSLQPSEFGTSRSRSPNMFIKSKRGGAGVEGGVGGGGGGVYQTSNITPFPPA